MSKMNIMCLLLVSAIVVVSCPEQAAAKNPTGAGNCLSLPVIWSEGITKELRGTFGVTTFTGASEVVDGVTWYYQQDENNEWQAESADWSAAPVEVTTIDWGDNLEARSWTIRSLVRTEVVLYQDLGVPMTGYEMFHISGEGTTEVWGTNGVDYASNEATVYSGVARYTIQKLNVVNPYDDTTGLPIPSGDLGLIWDAAAGVWTGPVGAMLYNSAVWEAEGVLGHDLTSIYKSETNIPGKIIYGYNWNLKRTNDGTGFYRITFSLDADGGHSGEIPCNTFFTAGTSVKFSENVEGGGIGVIDTVENLTYIDVLITAK